jgi:hypothetical protein
MSHIHVCLVSDQPIPNLTSVLQFRPDTVLLLFTDDFKAKKDRLKAVLKNHRIHVEERTILPYDLQNVIQVCEGVLADFPDTELSLNITGGTKISTLGAFQVFYSADKPIWYVNSRDHEIVQVSPKSVNLPITAKIGIKEYLAAYGFNLTGYQKDDEPLMKRRNISKYLVDLAVNKDWAIGKLNSAMPDTKGLRLPCTVKLPDLPEMEELVTLLEQAGLVHNNVDSISISDASIVDYLRGFWFEEYVYSIAKGIGADEVRLNVTGTWDAAVKCPPANEFDVMIAKGTQLAIISCKTANPNCTKDGGNESVGKEYLYELDSLSDNALGLFGKRMIASARPLTNSYVRDRAGVLRIELIDGKNILTLKDKLQSWLNR